MFNERDRRCAAVRLILSTNPSYDNRTIASTLKMQIRTVQCAQGDKNKVSSYGYGLWCGFKWGPHHIFEVNLKVNTKVYLDVLKSVVIPWCNQVVCGRPSVWQQDSALAHKSKETQAWLQKEFYNFVLFSHLPPPLHSLNPLDYFVWSYVENIMNMTSHNTKASLIAAICWCLWKRHAPAFGNQVKCQIYCIDCNAENWGFFWEMFFIWIFLLMMAALVVALFCLAPSVKIWI